MSASAARYTKTQPGRSPKTSQGPPGRPPRDARRAPRGSQEHRWTLQGLANDSQKALWSLPEAPLERCIRHAGEVGGPYESIANSIKNGPCSSAEGPQTTHRRPQKAFWRRPSTQKSSQETTKLPLEPHKRHPRDPSTPQGPPSRTSGNAWRAPRDAQERHWTPQSAPKSFPKGSLEAHSSSSGKMYPYLRGFCGPYESIANSNQNVPWSVSNGAQETPKDTQETASNQNKPPRNS